MTVSIFVYFPAIIICLALIMYLWTLANVGRMRARHKIMPPTTTGHPEFERAFRVQQNTLEQLVIFLPSLWLFSCMVSALWGPVIGAVWILARILYALGYYKAVPQRMLGFAISLLANGVLLFGTLGVLVVRVLSS
jgi:glutathione S-transferase